MQQKASFADFPKSSAKGRKMADAVRKILPLTLIALGVFSTSCGRTDSTKPSKASNAIQALSETGKKAEHQSDHDVQFTEYLSSIAQYGEDISILVDFGIDSSQPRFFVYDNRSKKIIDKSKCAHGSGGGSTATTPVFSNEVGSNCSSLGEYSLTVNSKLNNTGMPCIRLKGLNSTNSNAEKRGITIHEAPLVADDISIGVPIPVSEYISSGCFAISTNTFKQLQKLICERKTIYLYAVCN